VSHHLRLKLLRTDREKYREGKVKSTLREESKVPEIENLKQLCNKQRTFCIMGQQVIFLCKEKSVVKTIVKSEIVKKDRPETN